MCFTCAMYQITDWVERIISGDRLALSRAITLIESEAPDHQNMRSSLLEAVERISVSGSFRLAVTGVPGAGKSTLIDRLGLAWIADGCRVAVLAIDPSSSISNGSVLGDKTRMNDLARSSEAFIRPSPTRLRLGGVASHTFEAMLLCEAAGFDRIIIETVGVGQSETLVSELTDCCLLLLVTGTGDDLQGVKRGILEAADMVLVNKADGLNTDSAKAFARELKSISSLWANRMDGEKPSILTGSTEDTDSMLKLLQAIEKYRLAGIKNGYISQQRTRQKVFWMDQLVISKMEWLYRHHPEMQKVRDEMANQINMGHAGLSTGVQNILQHIQIV